MTPTSEVVELVEEPVAWRWRLAGYADGWTYGPRPLDWTHPEKWEVQPLYLRPTPADASSQAREGGEQRAAPTYATMLDERAAEGERVEQIARMIDPTAFEEYYLEDGRVDVEVANIFEDAVIDAREKAQSIASLFAAEIERLNAGWHATNLAKLEAEADGGKADAAATHLENARLREALDRIAHPEYGLGFSKLRGIGRQALGLRS